MTEVNAIVLDRPGSEASRKICRVLEFFGVESRVVGGGAGKKLEISERFGNIKNGKSLNTCSSGRYRVFGTVGDLGEIAGMLEADQEKREWWVNSFASAFCCVEGDGDGLVELARK